MNYFSNLPNNITEDNLQIGNSVLEQLKRATSKDRLAKTGQYDRIKGARSGWLVHKFGGSSFANPDSYSFVADMVNSFDGKNLIVVSAMNGITNVLYSLCDRAREGSFLESPELTTIISRISQAISIRLGDSLLGRKEMQRFATDLFYLTRVLSYMSAAAMEDQAHITSLVVGYGEIWSARLLTQIMRHTFSRSAAFMDAREILVVESHKGDDHISVCWDVTRTKLKNWWTNRKHCDVLVVTGFIARTLHDDLPTTLKRNGSDFTATIFSVLSKALSVTIWKDVDGMFTADPKKFPDAKFIPSQTYEEAEEASLRGAFVIQKDCIEPAREHNIPIFLRNCFNLACPGTRIGNPEFSYDEELFFMDECLPLDPECEDPLLTDVDGARVEPPSTDLTVVSSPTCFDSDVLSRSVEESDFFFLDTFF